MNLSELNKVATAMVAPGRGILAADESTGTIKEALRRARRGIHARHPARLSRNAVPLHRGHVEIHFRRHSL